MAHREDIRAFLESLELKGEEVIDWGSGSKPVERYIKHTDCTFTRVDKNDHHEYPPHHKLDFTKGEVSIGYFTVAFCMEVLEHTTDPRMVLRNIFNNLRSGGTLYLSVPFLFPEHGDEDYIRLTSIGLRYFTEQAGFIVKDITEIEQGYLMVAEREL